VLENIFYIFIYYR